MVDAPVSKTGGSKSRVGSSPTFGTTFPILYSKTASNGAVFVILSTICRPKWQVPTPVGNNRRRNGSPHNPFLPSVNDRTSLRSANHYRRRWTTLRCRQFVGAGFLDLRAAGLVSPCQPVELWVIRAQAHRSAETVKGTLRQLEYQANSMGVPGARDWLDLPMRLYRKLAKLTAVVANADFASYLASAYQVFDYLPTNMDQQLLALQQVVDEKRGPIYQLGAGPGHTCHCDVNGSPKAQPPIPPVILLSLAPAIPAPTGTRFHNSGAAIGLRRFPLASGNLVPFQSGFVG